MKKILSALFVGVVCVLGLSQAHAAASISPSFTYISAVSSATVSIITVSTSIIGGASASQMDSPQLAGRTAVEIQNIDATATLWCLISSTAPAASAGHKITAGNSWIVNMLDNVFYTSFSTTTNRETTTYTNVKFYCISDGAAATKAAVTQAF